MAKVYDAKQVAEMLKVSISTVRRLVREGKLKAFKVHNRGYLVNEISLLVFMGHKIEDCISKEDFEEALKLFSKDAGGKVDRDKFFEYYCSLFSPGPELPYDYFIIKDKPIQESKTKHISELVNEQEHKIKEEPPSTIENNEAAGVILTKADVIGIIKGLNIIQEILKSKLIG